MIFEINLFSEPSLPITLTSGAEIKTQNRWLNFMRLPLSMFLILLTALLSGCGKKSPLTLPEEEPKKMVQSTASDQATLRLISFQESK